MHRLPLLLIAAASAWLLATGAARAADPGSTNRVVLTACPALQTGPGITAALACQANGNALNQSAAETANPGGRLQASAEARVSFEAITRRALTESWWLDSLVYEGGATPAGLQLDFRLDGLLGAEITRGTISPAGVEQGTAEARLTVSALPGQGWAGRGAVAERIASLGRAEAGRWQQPVNEAVSLRLDLEPLAPGAQLELSMALQTVTTASNQWFRQGAGSVLATTQAQAGWVGLAWLDGAGNPLGDAVQWRWAQALMPVTAPVPEPGSAVLAAAGLLVVGAAIGRRRSRA